MRLTYKGSELQSFLLTLIDEAIKGFSRWTRHTIAGDLPECVKRATNGGAMVPRWYRSGRTDSDLVLVVEENEALCYTQYKLFGIDKTFFDVATLLTISNDEPDSLELPNVLAHQIEKSSVLDEHERILGFITDYSNPKT